MTKNRLFVLRAWAVHVYTSLGLPLGFFALLAAFAGKPQLMFIILGLAFLIDGTDGTLARRWKVTTFAHQFDGRKLDDIVDFINYTFIPVVFMYQYELVPREWAPVFILVLLSSIYGFCQTEAKTDDGFFTGFPSYWNIIALYFYLIGHNPVINGIVLAAFAVMVFVPTKYISTKTIALRNVSLVLTVIWIVMMLAIIATFNDPNPLLVYGSLFYPVYYEVASFYLHFQAKAGKIPLPHHA